MNKLTLFILLMVLSSVSVFAFGPNTHINITRTALAEAPDSLIKTTITKNMDACLSGIEYPDVGIFYYYSNFKEYAGLHNYNVVDEMLRLATSDRERAFVYCYKLHLAEDAISHNYFIPAAIRNSKLPDYWVHPVEEEKIEGHFIESGNNNIMSNHAEFDALVQKATNKDWSADAVKLNFVLGGTTFYSKAYNPDTSNWFGQVQNGIFFVLKFVTSEDKTVDYRKLAVEEAKAVLRGETSALDPAGSYSRNSADDTINLILYVLSVVAIILIYYISWRLGWI